MERRANVFLPRRLHPVAQGLLRACALLAMTVLLIGTETDSSVLRIGGRMGADEPQKFFAEEISKIVAFFSGLLEFRIAEKDWLRLAPDALWGPEPVMCIKCCERSMFFLLCGFPVIISLRTKPIREIIVGIKK